MNPSPANTRLKTFSSWERAAVAILLLAGVTMRLRQYLTGRSLWADEAMLALNIVNRGFGGMFQPLDYDQGAPIGFLLVEKIFNSILGKNEFILRLFPLFVGLLSLWLFYLLSRNLFIGWSGFLNPDLKVAAFINLAEQQEVKQIAGRAGLLTALALFAFNPRLVYYSSEVKQYIVDVFMTIMLLLLAAPVLNTAPRKRDFAWLALAGLIALWFSHPALFVLAGIGLALVIIYFQRRDFSNLRFVMGIGVFWVLEISFLYFLILKDLSQNAYMREYWQGAFLPVPPWSDPGWFTIAIDQGIRGQFGMPYVTFFVFALMLVGWLALSQLHFPAPNRRGGVRQVQVLRGGSSGETYRDVTKQSRADFANNEASSHRRFGYAYGSAQRGYAVIFACILLVTLFASALQVYPVFERMILFLVPIGSILLGRVVEEIYQRLQNYPFLRVLSVSVLAGYLIYGPLVTSFQSFIEPKYFEHIRPTMEYLRDSWKDGDALYVSYGALPAFRFYTPFYGLENVSYQFGRREDYNNPQNILTRFDTFKGQSRAWILFSHVYEKGDFNERDFVLNYLNQSGEKRREFRMPGTSVFLYLYDLENK